MAQQSLNYIALAKSTKLPEAPPAVLSPLETKPESSVTISNREALKAIKASRQRVQAQSIAEHFRAVSQNIDTPFIAVSLDVEAFEHDGNLITEIGLAWCKSSTFQEPPPDNDVIPLSSRHLIIKENRNHYNGTWVPDQRHGFLFGESEFVRTANIGAWFKTWAEEFDLPMVLVGHTISSDVKWLESLKIRLPVKDTLDIEKFWRESGVRRPEDTKSSLEHIATSLGLSTERMHNAGNDAVYTLQSYILLNFPSLTFESPMAARLQAIQEWEYPTDIKSATPRQLQSIQRRMKWNRKQAKSQAKQFLDETLQRKVFETVKSVPVLQKPEAKVPEVVTRIATSKGLWTPVVEKSLTPANKFKSSVAKKASYIGPMVRRKVITKQVYVNSQAPVINNKADLLGFIESRRLARLAAVTATS